MEILFIICLALLIAERGWVRGSMAAVGYGILGAVMGIVLFIVAAVVLIGFITMIFH